MQKLRFFVLHMLPLRNISGFQSSKRSSTLAPAYNEQIDAKKTACCRVVTELFNIAVNYIDAKKSTRHRRVLVVTELVVSGTQCTRFLRKSNPVNLLTANFYLFSVNATLAVICTLPCRQGVWSS